MKVKNLYELTIGSDKTYKKHLRDYFGKIAPDLFDMVEAEERAIKNRIGENGIAILESDSGKLSIKYIDAPEVILVLGFVSEGGRISPKDYRDVLELYSLIIKRMKKGKCLMANMNNNSEKFVDGLIRKAKKEGYKVKKTILRREVEFVPNPNNLKELKWKSIRIDVT